MPTHASYTRPGVRALLIALVALWTLLKHRADRRVVVRIAALASFVVYLSTLGPHLSHHIGKAAAESGCTVLFVIDSTYTGLTEDQPPPVLAPEPVSELPVPAVLSHLAVFYFSSTYSRAPPGTLLVPTRL